MNQTYNNFAKNLSHIMKAEIISIGDEILIGQITNTNATWMSQELNNIGVRVTHISSVGDNSIDIKSALDLAESRVDIILITGGLGPTKDDITKKVFCEYFNSSLVLNNEVLNDVTEIFKSYGRTVSELNRLQAMVPDNCQIIRNARGTAPGMVFKRGTKIFVSMPGVPFEMKSMMSNSVLPMIKSEYKLEEIYHRTILTQGIGESSLAEQIEDWENSLPEYIKLAYLPSPGIVRLRMSVYGGLNAETDKTLSKKEEELHAILGQSIYGYNEDKLEELIGKELLKRSAHLVIAESCTGGSISKAITSISGSSAYYLGGVTAYDNSVKNKILGVSERTLQEYGAVSEETVMEMALGVKKSLTSNYSIATTGIAGPTGGSEEKPVGTIWLAAASEKKIVTKKLQLGKDRLINIERSTIAAMALFYNLLREDQKE